MKPIQVGLLGIGTVGSGTFNVLRRNQAEIKRRAGRGIEITMVADLDVAVDFNTDLFTYYDARLQESRLTALEESVGNDDD